ncbi:MAG: PDZ domain-containing protein [Ruminococcaceae bacterium]|nr:PDZ domain-containing protein [Oscillospiraceae bacterium]
MEDEKRLNEDACSLPEEVAEAPAELETNETPSASDAPVSLEAESAAILPAEEAAAQEADAEEAAAEEVPAKEAPVAPAISPDWQFGTSAPAPVARKTHQGRPFLITFIAVFAVCVLLLIGTFLLGDGSFEIIRTVFTERTVYVREYDSESGLLTPNEAADVVRKSTVTVMIRTDTGTGIGSGFVYSADGYICTNYHVIEGATTVQVMLPDGRTVDAQIKGGNADADVAVLKIDGVEGLVPAVLGESASLLTGDDVVAVGSPGKVDYAGTATFGKVSYPNRLVAMDDDSGMVIKKMNLVQTDTSVNPGNSGGPLADMYGRVVGVVVMKVATINGKTFDGIGFALPIDGVKIIVDAIIQSGRFTGQNPIAESRSLLGVSGRGLVGGMWYDDPMAENVQESATEKDGYFRMPTDGIFVMNVNGSNALNKLQAGDIITAINGMRMYSIYDVVDQVNRYHVGERVTVTYQRMALNGSYQTHTVEIALIAE